MPSYWPPLSSICVKTAQIVSRGKQPGMARHAAEGEAARIVDLADHPGVAAFFGRGGTLLQLVLRFEGGLVHAQRCENVLVGEGIQRLAADRLDDFGEKNVVDVAIGEFAAGLLRRLQFEQPFPGLVGAALIVL